MVRLLGGVDWYPRARPQAALLLPHGHATEATQYHVMVGVFPGVPDGHIL